jgi:hypothetical protein
MPRDLNPRRSSYVCRLILAKCLLEMVGAVSCTRHNDGYWNGYGVYDCNPLPNHLFKNNIGIAMSIGSAGSSIGGIVYTYVACQLLRHANFQVTCLAMGGIMLGTMIPLRCLQTVPWTRLPANENRLLERRQATRAYFHYHVSRHVPDHHGIILWLLLREYLNQILAFLMPEDMG